MDGLLQAGLARALADLGLTTDAPTDADRLPKQTLEHAAGGALGTREVGDWIVKRLESGVRNQEPGRPKAEG